VVILLLRIGGCSARSQVGWRRWNWQEVVSVLGDSEERRWPACSAVDTLHHPCSRRRPLAASCCLFDSASATRRHGLFDCGPCKRQRQNPAQPPGLTALVRQRGETIPDFKVGPGLPQIPACSGLAAAGPAANLDKLLLWLDWCSAASPGWGRRPIICLVEGGDGLFDAPGTWLEGSSLNALEP